MWSNGIIPVPETGTKYTYSVKYYAESSAEFGLNGGRISKLTIRRLNEDKDLYAYERGESVPCANAEVEAVLAIILQKYQ